MKNNIIVNIGILFIAVSLLFIFPLVIYLEYRNKEIITVTVIDKERVTTKQSSKYLIFTENEVFKNVDMLFVGKWNSSDIYGKIKEGNTYTFEVRGTRIHLLSSYRNIVKIIE